MVAAQWYSTLGISSTVSPFKDVLESFSISLFSYSSVIQIKTILEPNMRASILDFALLAAAVTAQHSVSTTNECSDGFYPASDTVTFTTSYTLAQVISIIGDYKNII